mmetsp:Transcript_97999/g.224709  ORF Transcript_97999/g.224709 Transcript_97999/m.224709 type:complete len:201 (-) Transcript_97999:292-894(-)
MRANSSPSVRSSVTSPSWSTSTRSLSNPLRRTKSCSREGMLAALAGTTTTGGGLCPADSAMLRGWSTSPGTSGAIGSHPGAPAVMLCALSASLLGCVVLLLGTVSVRTELARRVTKGFCSTQSSSSTSAALGSPVRLLYGFNIVPTSASAALPASDGDTGMGNRKSPAASWENGSRSPGTARCEEVLPLAGSGTTPLLDS